MTDKLVGKRCQVLPHTDLFMMGVRYATVTYVGRKRIHIEHEMSGRAFDVRHTDVRILP